MTSQARPGYDTVKAQELSWPRLHEALAQGTSLVLSIGSFEQHGPHLPLNTDSLIVEELARRLAQRLGGLTLPTLPFGAPSRPRSGGGDLFPVPDLPLSTLISAVGALAEGSLALGCRRLIVLSWHMENAAVLWDALRSSVRHGKATIQLFDAPWVYLGRELEEELFPEGDPSWSDDHAGRLETAMMLYLAPQLVGKPPAPEQFIRRHGYDVLPTPRDAVPSSGVVLDARKVTRDMGRRSTDAIIEGVASAIAAEDGHR